MRQPISESDDFGNGEFQKIVDGFLLTGCRNHGAEPRKDKTATCVIGEVRGCRGGCAE